MKVLFAFVLLIGSVFAHDGPHPDDPVKRSEHMAALALVNPATAVHVSGNASSITVPATADLYVPEGAEFIVDRSLDVRRIRFDGTLRLATTPLTLRVETLIGNTTGKLLIPASSSRRAIQIKSRGPRDRIGDPTDVSGGIILHCKENLLAGEAKTSVAIPSLINTTDNKITFREPVVNWQVGDQLLIPGVKWTQPDSLVVVSTISADRQSVTVSGVIGNHELPDGSYPAIGNTARSLVIESESTDLSQRGHVMVMHEHTGTTISHVAFLNLGRTSVESTPTRIVLGPDGEFVSGDENTIGRYPFHVHGRNGASPDVAPHLMTGCVVYNSPSHGIVNHGSHVSVQKNIVYDCAGSNLFGENGIEIGDFTGNLAVLSRGRVSPANRIDEIVNKKNFGWEGTTLWLQGPGITVSDNHLYRAKRALMETDYTMLADAGPPTNGFPVAYMRPGPQKDRYLSENKTKVSVFQVPSHFSNNTGAGAPVGLAMVHSMYDTYSVGDGLIHTKGRYVERSKLHGFRFFNVDTGMQGTYLGHLDVRNCRFDGNLKLTTSFVPYNGTFAGTKIHDVNYSNCEFRRFQVAVVDRGWSDFLVENCIFQNNLIDISIITRSTIKTPHEVTLKTNQHLGRPEMASLYATKLPKSVWGSPFDYYFTEQYVSRGKAPANDPNPLDYIRQTFFVSPHTIDGRLMYYPDNADTFVPYSGTGTEYDDKTNAQLWTEKQVAVNGRYFSTSDPNLEQLNVSSNLPIMVAKAIIPDPDPDPKTLEERVKNLEDAVKELRDLIQTTRCQCEN